ncbi:MAG: DUF294 nucleotidyltransferase-like domain-containing protein [Lautropia sp.]
MTMTDVAGRTEPLLSMLVGSLMTPEPLSIAPTESVRNAARLMRERHISCLPVCATGKLVGILTLRDLCNRVIAVGGSVDAPVSTLMTHDPATLPPVASAFDALLLMTQRNIGHLPVMDAGRLVGIVTNTNFLRQQTASALFMVGDIQQCADAAAIAAVVAQVPRLLLQLVGSGATPDQIGRMISSITDAATRRLIALAGAALGPAPVRYAWLACGSQGRQEQSGVSDQDNCLILEDAYDPAQHGEWFAALARFVCDGLDACGYVYCPGEMMATTPRWRQPLAVWRGYFRDWVDSPEPMAQMLASVMFDLRVIAGDASLHEALQAESLDRAARNSIFVSHMVGNSLTHRPPLGLLGGLATQRTGPHKGRIDLKHAGIVPIVDIARVYALSARIGAVNTHDRLAAGREARVLSDAGARDLLDAYAAIGGIRLRHQAAQVEAGARPDNFLAPGELSGLERSHLRDAFIVVRTIQRSLASRYQPAAR